MLPANTLNQQVAIITGGGTGLGRAMALEYSRLGARLVLASRSREHLEPTVAEIQKDGGEAIAVPTDVRDPAQVDRMIQETKKKFGGIDILVNNAAGNFICKAEELSPNGWRAVVEIVLNGTFFCTRAAGLEMIAQRRGGKILSVLATYAWTGGPGTVPLSRGKGRRTGPDADSGRGVGRSQDPHQRHCAGAGCHRGRLQQALGNPEAEKKLLSTIPVGRIGNPQEIAQAAAYLVSPYAEYINGETLTMDGGGWLGKGFLSVQ